MSYASWLAPDNNIVGKQLMSCLSRSIPQILTDEETRKLLASYIGARGIVCLDYFGITSNSTFNWIGSLNIDSAGQFASAGGSTYGDGGIGVGIGEGSGSSGQNGLGSKGCAGLGWNSMVFMSFPLGYCAAAFGVMISSVRFSPLSIWSLVAFPMISLVR
jgi:hypothetical protein